VNFDGIHLDFNGALWLGAHQHPEVAGRAVLSVAVEDSSSGIQAAHAAGIGHIVAQGPVEGQGVLTQVTGVRRAIPSLAQLLR